MNAKIGIAILAVACVGFAIALVVLKKQADTQQAQSAQTINTLSNQAAQYKIQMDDLNQANQNLNSDLATNRLVSLVLSNQLVEAAGILSNTASSLQDAQQQITNLNTQVADLEAKNQSLDQRLNSLSNTIAALDTQIAETQMKLATSETNNAFLDAELKKQIARRAELERQFNDMKTVRAQLHKLRDEAIIARNLAMIRAGIDLTKQPKGGQLLMQRGPLTAGTATAAKSPSYNLNVEVGSDGSVRVVSPTNAPAR